MTVVLMMATTMMTMTTMVHSARAASLWRGAWAGLIAASGARKIAQPLFLFLFLFFFFFVRGERFHCLVLCSVIISVDETPRAILAGRALRLACLSCIAFFMPM